MAGPRFSKEVLTLIRQYCIKESFTLPQVITRMVRELKDEHIRDALFKAFGSPDPEISDEEYYLRGFGDRY